MENFASSSSDTESTCSSINSCDSTTSLRRSQRIQERRHLSASPQTAVQNKGHKRCKSDDSEQSDSSNKDNAIFCKDTQTKSQKQMPPPSSKRLLAKIKKLKRDGNIESRKLQDKQQQTVLLDINDANGMIVEKPDEIVINKEAEILLNDVNKHIWLMHPTNVADICRGYVPDNYYEMIEVFVMELDMQDNTWMDCESLFGFLMYIAYISREKRCAVIHPTFTKKIANETRFISDDAKQESWGNPITFKTLIIPIFFNDHYGVCIYDRNTKIVTFYDSLAYTGTLRFTTEYKDRVKLAIQQFEENNNDDIIIVLADPSTYNMQTDGNNCGFHVCLIVEAYLVHDITFLEDLEIIVERRRIVQILLTLCSNIVPEYERRYPNEYADQLEQERFENEQIEAIDKFTSNEIGNDNEVEMENIYSSNSDAESTSSSVDSCVSSTSLRRSKRIQRQRSTSRTPTRKNKTSSTPTHKNTKMTSYTKCRKKHGKNLGCFSQSSNHLYDMFDCGKIGDKKCTHCSALMFKNELDTHCCRHGTIKLPAMKGVPREIQEIFNDKTKIGSNFRQYFRIYNCLLQFGSLEAGRKKSPGHGAPIILMNGDIKYNISPIFNRKDDVPVYGQLFMYDPDMAVDAVKKNVLFNRFKINEQVLKRLHKVLMKTHPLCEAYKLMYELYQEKLLEAQALGMDDVPHVTLVLLDPKDVPVAMQDHGLHPRQINLPQVKELCAFYASNDENEPLYRHGTWLKKKNNSNVRLSIYDRLTDCTHYVLNLAHGDFGYHPHIEKHIPPTAKKQQNRRRKQQQTNDVDDDYDHNDNNKEDDEECFDDVASEENKRKHVSIREFYNYHLAIRGDPKGANHFLYPYGSITQEYIIDQSMKVDQQRYEYIRNQPELCCAVSSEVRKVLESKVEKLYPDGKLGKAVQATASVPYLPRWYQQKFHDSSALFNRFGKPTFLITITSNPGGKEIKENILPKQNIADRPDIVCRVFKERLQHIRKLIESGKAFGPIKAYSETLEFQKRGGPHTHRVIALDSPNTPEFVDEYISAEIPKLPPVNDKSPEAEQQRLLRSLVLKYQVHRCNEHCLNDKGVCSRRFPYEYRNETLVRDKKPTLYKRRSPNNPDTENCGECVILPNGEKVTNANIVPYNKALLLIWQGHINMEHCYGDKVCVYVLKYVKKGSNEVFGLVFKVQNDGTMKIVNYDETKAVLKGHYRSACEAFTRLDSWEVVRMSHTVYRMQVHLPGDAPIYFRRDEVEKMLSKILNNTTNIKRKTQLEAFIIQCNQEKHNNVEEMRKLTFAEVPEKYTFNRKTCRWSKRKTNHRVFGRIYSVPPSKLELFALYQLILHRKGPTSWDDLKTPPGETKPCETFVDCATIMGLLDDQDVWKKTLEEGARILSPRLMRNLFMQILIFGNATHPKELWDEFLTYMYDGRNIKTDNERQVRINKALCLLNRLLSRHWKTNMDYGLPLPQHLYNSMFNEEEEFFFGAAVGNENAEYDETNPPNIPETIGTDVAMEYNDVGTYTAEPCYQTLNDQQKHIVDKVMEAFLCPPEQWIQHSRYIFMTGSGGTGKTYVYKTIIELCEKYHKYVMVTASTGAAAQLLPRGSTVHSAFRLPLDLHTAGNVPSIDWYSPLAKRIRKTELIIIDEISMLHKKCLQLVDQACRYCATKEMEQFPFGGKIVLIGGDWKQLLPVVSYGRVEDQLNACVKFCPEFKIFQEIILTQNMRVLPDEQNFLQLLEQIGTNQQRTGTFTVPSQMAADTVNDLINFVYDNGNAFDNVDTLHERLLLAPRRSTVNELNEEIMRQLPSEEKEYLSCDKSLTDNPVLNIYSTIHNVETLNREHPSGMPPHKLVLKIGAIVVLLRNFDVFNGKCNGTRLIITSFGHNLIHTKIASGPHRNKPCILMPQRFVYKEERPDGAGLFFSRMQFPIDLAFAMTINKAQGQTVSKMGLCLIGPVFSHGQLYVAMSRVRKAAAIKIYVHTLEQTDEMVTKNVVYPAVFANN